MFFYCHRFSHSVKYKSKERAVVILPILLLVSLQLHYKAVFVFVVYNSVMILFRGKGAKDFIQIVVSGLHTNEIQCITRCIRIYFINTPNIKMYPSILWVILTCKYKHRCKWDLNSKILVVSHTKQIYWNALQIHISSHIHTHIYILYIRIKGLSFDITLVLCA